MRGDVAIHFPKHAGIKTYAMLAGACWLSVEGVAEPVQLTAGDCFLLPRGLPFRLATDLSIPSIPYTEAVRTESMVRALPGEMPEGTPFIAGGHFVLNGGPAEMLRQALPPIVHIRSERDRAAMRWSLERLRDELRDPQPGSSLLAQQLAYMMLVQALRLHLGSGDGSTTGWLSALADPQMREAIAAMHGEPGRPWTLQTLAGRVGMSRSAFAQRFRETVGTTPLEYLTRWRMMLAAERLEHTGDGLCTISQALGYDSESAFGKAFRRVMGCSPRQYGKPSPRAGGKGRPVAMAAAAAS